MTLKNGWNNFNEKIGLYKGIPYTVAAGAFERLTP